MSLVALCWSFHLREHAETDLPKKCASASDGGRRRRHALHGMAAARFTSSTMAQICLMRFMSRHSASAGSVRRDPLVLGLDISSLVDRRSRFRPLRWRKANSFTESWRRWLTNSRSRKTGCGFDETMAELAWTSLADGSNDFVDRRRFGIHGHHSGTDESRGDEDAVSPEDIDEHLDKWRSALATGRRLKTQRAGESSRWGISLVLDPQPTAAR